MRRGGGVVWTLLRCCGRGDCGGGDDRDGDNGGVQASFKMRARARSLIIELLVVCTRTFFLSFLLLLAATPRRLKRPLACRFGVALFRCQRARGQPTARARGLTTVSGERKLFAPYATRERAQKLALDFTPLLQRRRRPRRRRESRVDRATDADDNRQWRRRRRRRRRRERGRLVVRVGDRRFYDYEPNDDRLYVRFESTRESRARALTVVTRRRHKRAIDESDDVWSAAGDERRLISGFFARTRFSRSNVATSFFVLFANMRATCK